jgi:hypothetical protein
MPEYVAQAVPSHITNKNHGIAMNSQPNQARGAAAAASRRIPCGK